MTSKLAPPFYGLFRLVPLMDAGNRPVQKNGHSLYALGADVSFRLASGQTVQAFAGQTTDLASIPMALWNLLPPDGPWALAAVLHDMGYATSGSYEWKHHQGRTRAAPYTRAEVDDILLQAMVALGVPAWKRFLIYRSVRIFGGAAFGT